MALKNHTPKRAWQRMLSGRRLNVLEPSPIDIEIDDIFDISINELDEHFKTILNHKSDQFLLPMQVIDNELVVMINCTPKKMMSDFEVQNILISNQLKAYSEKELRNLIQDSVIEDKK